MHLPRKEYLPSASRVIDELRAGIRYVTEFTPIRAVLLLLALVCLMGMPYSVLMPMIASNVLHGGPHTYGFLMGAAGVGALVGALYLASRQSVLGLGRIIVAAAALFGASLVAFSFSRNVILSLVLLLFVGMGFMVQTAASNTVLQSLVREEMRGRVMAFYTMAFMGTTPFGSLMAGELASRYGAPRTIAFGGAACVLGALVFARALPGIREKVRPIYREQGILPNVAAVRDATEVEEAVQR
jgi:MFS family permease